MKESDIEYVSYQRYSGLMLKLYQLLSHNDKIDTIKYVYGIPRGGLPIAVHISHHLSIQFIPELREDLYPVLIVDDVADSGRTLSRTLNDLSVLIKENILIATLFYKKTSIITPDYYAAVTDKWVVFPWEVTKHVHLVP
jgi:hypoxanthine phosphoribosyltransferase